MDVDAQKRRASPSSPYHTRLVDLGISLLGGIRAIVVYYETNVLLKKERRSEHRFFAMRLVKLGSKNQASRYVHASMPNELS